MMLGSMKWNLLFALAVMSINQVLAQDEDIRMFIFGHSLINHEFQINPTSSQETSVPHWLHFLSQADGENIFVSGQYGFLPQHANLPPIAQWGFDFVPSAWESDYESFAEANFTDVMITPGNFIQWQAPDENYFNEDISPVGATNSIIEWCSQQEENLSFYIYENWPDMAEYLSSGFPPNETEWSNYNEYLQLDFVDWFEEYYQLIKEANPNNCVNLIPVGRLISELLMLEPFNQIPIDELYEDDAPHGRANIYFLASMITYMAINEKQAPVNYVPTEIINPLIRENYASINLYFWNRLQEINDENNEIKVFCQSLVAAKDNSIPSSKVKIVPNPSAGVFNFEDLKSFSEVQIMNAKGQLVDNAEYDKLYAQIDLTECNDGLYFIKILRPEYGDIQILRIVKMSH